MTNGQLAQIFNDINEDTHDFNQWFKPYKFAYVVLKDNSLLYIGLKDMWYLDSTDGLMYVAGALVNETSKTLQMPATGITNQDNINRMITVIDFENINHMVLHYQGQHLGGGR